MANTLRLVVFLCAALAVGAPHAAEIVVPDDYATIQAAIDAASNGDSITIDRGTYREHLSLPSGALNLTLRGRETAQTLLEAVTTAPLITISGASNVTIRNLTFVARVSTGSSLQVSAGSSAITIVNNVFFDPNVRATAISVQDASSATIENNVFYRHTTAISRANNLAATLTSIRNNIFASNTTAIPSIDFASTITHNHFYDNGTRGDAGTNFQTGDPLFVDASADTLDFHLQVDSPSIDNGTGDNDIIDDTAPDIGAYGGLRADVFPFPAADVVTRDASDEAGVTAPAIGVQWSATDAYAVAEGGGYLVRYGRDTYEDNSDDAGNVTAYLLQGLAIADAPGSSPVLEPPAASNQTLDLSWSTVSGATGYVVYYGDADQQPDQDARVEVGDVSTYSLSGLDNLTVYRVQVAALIRTTYQIVVQVYDAQGLDSDGEPRHGSYIRDSDIKRQQLGESLEGPKSEEQTGMPEPVAPVPDLPDEGCFIATAAYGYYDATEVQVLRDFRDEYLLTNAGGQALVRWYYRNSPPAAQFVSEHPQIKPWVRAALWPLVQLAAVATRGSAAEQLSVLALVLILPALVWQRRRAWRFAVRACAGARHV